MGASIKLPEVKLSSDNLLRSDMYEVRSMAFVSFHVSVNAFIYGLQVSDTIFLLGSFFCWFSEVVQFDREIDEIANIIRGGLWPNPLQRF